MFAVPKARTADSPTKPTIHGHGWADGFSLVPVKGGVKTWPLSARTTTTHPSTLKSRHETSTTPIPLGYLFFKGEPLHFDVAGRVQQRHHPAHFVANFRRPSQPTICHVGPAGAPTANTDAFRAPGGKKKWDQVNPRFCRKGPTTFPRTTRAAVTGAGQVGPFYAPVGSPRRNGDIFVDRPACPTEPGRALNIKCVQRTTFGFDDLRARQHTIFSTITTWFPGDDGTRTGLRARPAGKDGTGKATRRPRPPPILFVLKLKAPPGQPLYSWNHKMSPDTDLLSPSRKRS